MRPNSTSRWTAIVKNLRDVSYVCLMPFVCYNDFWTSLHDHVSFMIIGVNAVLRSLKFNKGDALLINTNTYRAVQNTCRYVADRHGKNHWIMMHSALFSSIFCSDSSTDVYNSLVVYRDMTLLKMTSSKMQNVRRSSNFKVTIGVISDAVLLYIH